MVVIYSQLVKRKTKIESMMKEIGGMGCSFGGLLGVGFFGYLFYFHESNKKKLEKQIEKGKKYHFKYI